MNKKMWWSGCIMTGLVAALMIFSAGMKFASPPEMVKEFVKSGWSADLLLPLGITELACAVIYLIPRTSVLGAILLTGYLGGAVSATLRTGGPFIMPAVVGVLAWGGIFLRDQRVRDLIPLRR